MTKAEALHSCASKLQYGPGILKVVPHSSEIFEFSASQIGADPSFVAPALSKFSAENITCNFSLVNFKLHETSVLASHVPLAIVSAKSGQSSTPMKYLLTMMIVKKTMQEIEKPLVYPEIRRKESVTDLLT